MQKNVKHLLSVVSIVGSNSLHLEQLRILLSPIHRYWDQGREPLPVTNLFFLFEKSGVNATPHMLEQELVFIVYVLYIVFGR